MGLEKEDELELENEEEEDDDEDEDEDEDEEGEDDDEDDDPEEIMKDELAEDIVGALENLEGVVEADVDVENNIVFTMNDGSSWKLMLKKTG